MYFRGVLYYVPAIVVLLILIPLIMLTAVVLFGDLKSGSTGSVFGDMAQKIKDFSLRREVIVGIVVTEVIVILLTLTIVFFISH